MLSLCLKASIISPKTIQGALPRSEMAPDADPECHLSASETWNSGCNIWEAKPSPVREIMI